eukprot:ANDGO_00059.mRNA.1 Short-chain dehydrogenase TIC 32
METIIAMAKIAPYTVSFGSGARRTADEAAGNADLSGKYAIVTGSNTGIGYETARTLAMHGARVVLACRDVVKADAAKSRIEADIAPSKSSLEYRPGSVSVLSLDLSSLDAVENFCTNFRALGFPRLDILVNNAGLMAPPTRLLSANHLELQIATNHLGHFLLTLCLLPMLQASPDARIVNISSEGHRLAQCPSEKSGTSPAAFWNEMSDASRYSKWTAYGRSKLANVLFTTELANRLKSSGGNSSNSSNITVVAVHPGVVNTELMRHMGIMGTIMSATSRLLLMKTPKQGAATTVHCITQPKSSIVSGGYYADCRVAPVHSDAQRPDVALGLWKWSVATIQSLGFAVIADDQLSITTDHPLQ